MRSISSFFIRLLIILFIMTLIASLIRTIWTSYQALQNVEHEKQNVELLEKQTEALEQKLQEATSSFELERRARENLHLQKPDESIIRVE